MARSSAWETAFVVAYVAELELWRRDTGDMVADDGLSVWAKDNVISAKCADRAAEVANAAVRELRGR